MYFIAFLNTGQGWGQIHFLPNIQIQIHHFQSNNFKYKYKYTFISILFKYVFDSRPDVIGIVYMV